MDNKVKCIIIIGLDSGERIMMDCLSDEQAKTELFWLKSLMQSAADAGSAKIFTCEKRYYLNGQRYIAVQEFFASKIEYVGITEIDQGQAAA